MLNPVELNERVRSLKPVRRVAYSVMIAGGIVIAFVLLIALGVGLAGALVVMIMGSPLTLPDDLIALSLPVMIIFMFTIGLSGVNTTRQPASGQSLRRAAGQAGRSGFVVGLVSGVIFGLGWGFLINADPILFAIVMGAALSLPLALFRVTICSIETLTLRLIEGQP